MLVVAALSHASMWVGPQTHITRVQLIARDAGDFTHVTARFSLAPSGSGGVVVAIRLSQQIRVVGMSITVGRRTDVGTLDDETVALQKFVTAHATSAPALLVHDGGVLRLGVYVFDDPVVATLELELPHDGVLDFDPQRRLDRFEIDLDGLPIHAEPVVGRTTIDFAGALVAPRPAAATSLDRSTAFVVVETGARPRPRSNERYARTTHRPEAMHWLSEANLVEAIAAHAEQLSDCLALGAAWRAVGRDPTFDEPAVVATVEHGRVVDVRIDGVALATERTCIASEVLTWTFVDAGHRKTLRARLITTS